MAHITFLGSMLRPSMPSVSADFYEELRYEGSIVAGVRTGTPFPSAHETSAMAHITFLGSMRGRSSTKGGRRDFRDEWFTNGEIRKIS